MRMLKNIKNEQIGRTYATLCGLLIVVLTLSIMFFVIYNGLQIFIKDKYTIGQILFSKEWSMEKGEFGAVIFIVGSALVSIGAVILSAPIAVAVAIFLNHISKGYGKKLIQASLELFVGIPSVVYGLLGILYLVPFIKNVTSGTGFSLLAGIIVLSIMILPTIASLAADAIKIVPHEYIEASYGLGATRWQTIKKVVLPAASNGIFTGIVLGLARAFGEALAVQMVIGNTIKIPDSILSPTTTLTGILTMNMANAIKGTPEYHALWTLAALLLIVSFIFILIIRAIGRRGEVK
nr:phosphate ABC transporter permease subunit PstC [Clostridium cellulovorans]